MDGDGVAGEEGTWVTGERMATGGSVQMGRWRAGREVHDGVRGRDGR